MAHTDHRLGAHVALLARTWRAELDRRLNHLGLSQARWLVLLHLARHPEPPTQSELAQMVGVECPTLARLLVGQSVRGESHDVSLLGEVGEQPGALVGDGRDLAWHFESSSLAIG